MSKRYPRLLVADMLDRIRLIEQYTAGLSDDTILNTQLICDGIVRSLEVIGEAARQLPEDFRTANPDIPWRQIIGLRNKAIHEYAGVDMTLILEIIQDDLPSLQSALAAIQFDD